MSKKQTLAIIDNIMTGILSIASFSWFMAIWIAPIELYLKLIANGIFWIVMLGIFAGVYTFIEKRKSSEK